MILNKKLVFALSFFLLVLIGFIGFTNSQTKILKKGEPGIGGVREINENTEGNQIIGVVNITSEVPNISRIRGELPTGEFSFVYVEPLREVGLVVNGTAWINTVRAGQIYSNGLIVNGPIQSQSGDIIIRLGRR